MSKQEARALARQGKKMQHITFADDEYIYHDIKGRLRDEHGNILDEDDFWFYRRNECFDSEWGYYQGKN